VQFDPKSPTSWLDRHRVVSRRYTLLVLAAYFALAHLDRQVLAITLSPIGREFALNDLQLGLLSGLAFALFFATLGLPLALAAARLNRRNMIAVTIAMWSAMTMLSGLAQSYWQLLLARMGVGVGEAGALPASHAVISDRYGPHERASAMGVFMSGANVGVALALLGGGLIAQFYGWRAALLLAGLPGLLLAALIRLTVPEPAQRLSAAETPAAPGFALLRQTAAAIWTSLPMRLMVIATVLNTMTTFGMVAWLPTFLVREHGMALSVVGLYLAAAIGGAGALGTALSGRLADRFAARKPGWMAWVPALMLLIAKPFAIAGLLAAATGMPVLLSGCTKIAKSISLDSTSCSTFPPKSLSRNCMLGASSVTRFRSGGISLASNASGKVIEKMRALVGGSKSVAMETACSIARSASRMAGARRFASTVGTMPRPSRLNSGSPRCSRKRLSALDKAGWVSPSLFAARVMLASA